MAFSLSRKKDKSTAVKTTPKIVEQFNAMPPKKKALVLIIIIVVVGGLFTYLVAKPKYDNIKRLETNLASLEKDLATAKNNARDIDSVKQQVQEAEEAFNREIKALPETDEVPVLLTNISKAGQEENLDFMLFEPQKEIPFDFYAELPVKLEIVGEYHDIARFFSKLANFPRIVVIRNLSITPYTAGNTQRRGSATTAYVKPGFNLSVTCVASTYRFTEEEAPKAKSRKR